MQNHFTSLLIFLFLAAITGLAYTKPAVNSPQKSSAVFRPAGELAKRIDLCRQRLTTTGWPLFTEEFILADAALHPARRFNEYSGDLSGRYLGAMAMLPPKDNPLALRGLVQRLIAFQRPDGRFGNPDLPFTAEAIGPEHMALLWGNGRLLVGLMEYYSTQPDRRVLDAAIRLGDFLTTVRKECSAPQVRKRLEGQGANGYICFTQLIEGLVLLSRSTGNRGYLETAKEIVPLLQPRGIQHSHGYLTTLRGILMLHAETQDSSLLRFVRQAHDELVASPDYTVSGGVLEYFGSDPPKSERGGHARDEGCSEADFLRLSLQLWRATGELKYLECAERCLLNAFYFNQFNTGDFGHHVTFRQGFKPSESVGRAWWCCTMHGYRAFADVLGAAVAAEKDLLKINLFLDGEWSDDHVSLKLYNSTSDIQGGGQNTFTIEVAKAPDHEFGIGIRLPDWSTEPSVGGELQFKGHEENRYVVIRRRWQAKDRLNVVLNPKARLFKRDGAELPLADLGEKPIETALYYGPRLLAVDEASEPLFFGEPWQGNQIFLPAEIDKKSGPKANASGQPPLSVADAHLSCDYAHEGFPGLHPVTLRPISEQTYHGQSTVAVWLRYRAQSDKAKVRPNP